MIIPDYNIDEPVDNEDTENIELKLQEIEDKAMEDKS